MFYSLLYKREPKILLLFEIVPRLYQVQKIGYLILNVVHISVKRMIKSGIDVLLIGNNLVVIIRGLNHLQIFLLDQGSVEISTGVEPWLRSWWLKILTSMIPIDRFKQ